MVDRSADLNERVAKLGFPVFEVDPKSETNRTLAEVVQSKDKRLWEGFPVMPSKRNGRKSVRLRAAP